MLTGLLTGIIASRIISGYVGELISWRAMFVIAAGLMAVSAFFIARYFPNVEPTYTGSFGRLMLSIRDLALEYRMSLRYSIRAGFSFGSILALWGCLTFRISAAPFYQGSDVVGLLGIFGIVGAVSASQIGKYIPRYGTERINALGVALQTLAWIIMALFQNYYIGIILGIVIIDVGMQCVQLSNQSATMGLCPEAASRMNAIYMVCYFIGGSLAHSWPAPCGASAAGTAPSPPACL